MQTLTATYSPENNKPRLYSSSRLDSVTCKRVKATDFKWAPRQGLSAAPIQTPVREDLPMELRGEIGDEDTGPVECAEERADRFEDYNDKRAHDVSVTRNVVQAIGQRFEFG